MRTSRPQGSLAAKALLVLMSLVAASCGGGEDETKAGGQAPQTSDAVAVSGEVQKLLRDDVAPHYDQASDQASGMSCLELRDDGIGEAFGHEILSIHGTEGWAEIGSLALDSVDEFGYVHASAPSMSRISGVVPGDADFIIDRWFASTVARVESAGSEWIIGFRNGSAAHYLAVTDDELVYFNLCSEMAFAADLLDSYAQSLATQDTATTILRSIINGQAAHGRGEALRDFDEDRRTTTWDERDPAHRILDAELAPPDVVATLDEVIVRVGIPEGWRGDRDAVICTRIDLGWNECASLQLDNELDRTGGSLDLLALVHADVPTVLEVILLNPDGQTAGDSATLATLEVPASRSSDPTQPAAEVAFDSERTVTEILIQGNGDGVAATVIDGGR